MLRKQPKLINSRWGDLDIITLLFHIKFDDTRTLHNNYPQEILDKHSQRFLKMIRLLTNFGCKINSQKLLPYVERYSYHDEDFAKRVFNCLLHKGLYVLDYKLLSEEEIMLLEKQKFDRRDTWVNWGRKVVSDYLRLESRKLLHLYLRDLCPTEPKLCYDVIGEITSFL